MIYIKTDLHLSSYDTEIYFFGPDADHYAGAVVVSKNSAGELPWHCYKEKEDQPLYYLCLKPDPDIKFQGLEEILSESLMSFYEDKSGT